MELPPPTPPSFSCARRWTIGLHVALSIVAALSLVVMTNYLAARYFTRLYWVQDNPNRLSSLTVDLLKSLTNQVKITVYFDKQYSLFSSVSSLLNEYQLANPHLTVDYVDYIRNPSAAVLVKERYKLALLGEEFAKNLVIFDYNGRVKMVHEKELYDYDLAAVMKGQSQEFKRSNFKGEVVFTSALLSITDTKGFKAYFLEGLEHSPQDDDAVMGYSKFALLLQQLNVQVDVIRLGTQEIPSNCSLLIIAGPTQALSTLEQEKINQYLNQGGRLLLLLSARHQGGLGLDRLLANWQLRVGNDLVAETPSLNHASGNRYELVITNYPTPGHPIARPLLRSRLHLLYPRSVDKQPNVKTDADSPKVELLAASSADGIAIPASDFREGVPYPDLLRDRRGVIPVIAAVEKGSLQGVSADKTTRLVVCGDSIFLGNKLIDSLENRDFAVLAINWLLDRPRLMGGIAPRPLKEYQVVISATQMTALRWILLAGLPGSVLFLGLLVWLRRRA
jgi:ABC-2 type transport system permease protein